MSTGEIHVTDPDSVATYGTYAATLDTRIAGRGDAHSRGLLVLARQATPAWVLSGVGINLELISKLRGGEITEEEDEAMTAATLNLEMHQLISVADMPDGSPYEATMLWVEGWTETIVFGSWRIDFAVSEYCRTAALTLWDQVDAAVTWNTAPDVTWDELRCQTPTPAEG